MPWPPVLALGVITDMDQMARRSTVAFWGTVSFCALTPSMEVSVAVCNVMQCIALPSEVLLPFV